MLLAGVSACVRLIGAYQNSKFDSLWLSEALLLVLLPLSHADSTGLPRTEGHHLNVHDRSHQHVIWSLCHRMENVDVYQQNTDAYRGLY